jgi:hypothetical protein
MHRRAALGAALALILCDLTHPTLADQVTAREVARINNCLPKKIDVYQDSIGMSGQTIYRVDCTMPKMTGTAAPGPDALLISCDESLCTLLRSLTTEKK